MQEYIVRVYKDSTEWYNKDHTEWRNKDNKLHRLDGPAIEYADGSKE